MVSKEFSPLPIWTDRDQKRQSITIVNKVHQVASLKGAKPFKCFSFNESEERAISNFNKEQIFTLVSIANGADLAGDYEELVRGQGPKGKVLTSDKAITPINGDGNLIKFHSYYQGRIVLEAVYDQQKNDFPSFSEFFYYQTDAENEGLLELRHDQLSAAPAPDMEIFYANPMSPEEIDSQEKRDAQSSFYYFPHYSDRRLFGSAFGKEDGFLAIYRTIYWNGSQTNRSVALVTQDGQRGALFSFARPKQELMYTQPASLAVRRFDNNLNKDEQWVFAVSANENSEYKHFLKQLLTKREEPEWGQKLKPQVKLQRQQNWLYAFLDGEWVEAEPVVPSQVKIANKTIQCVSESLAAVFIGPRRTTVRVKFDASGNVSSVSNLTVPR